MIGKTLGNYRVTAKLGQGGMGDVFLAEHLRIERQVAIKVCSKDIIRDPQMTARFLDEARSTSLIKNDGIVDIYDCDVTDGCAYIVMEYLQGETVANRLRRHARLDWMDACEIARQIAAALAAAHDKGIVHRDLKPDNIFLCAGPGGAPSLTVKVLDFGIAKLLPRDPDRSYRTAPGALVGTPEYMSPEQCCGIGWIDHRADVYALGCVLYKMICGRAPFVSPRTRDVISAHMFQDPPGLEAGPQRLPRWLRALVRWMLAKRPMDRPASMTVVAREVDPFRSSLHANATWLLRVLRQRMRRDRARKAASAASYQTVSGP